MQDNISKKDSISDFGNLPFFGNFGLCLNVCICMRRNEPTERLYGREPWNEIRMMACIQDGLQLPPAQLRLLPAERHSAFAGSGDGIIEVTWRGRAQQYVIECKSRSTPQVIQSALSGAWRFANLVGLPPMVIVPYLSDNALAMLEKDEVSGVDLSGNGIIIAPDFTVWRSGQPNRFPDYQPIRNLYRGASAIFVRCLLLRGQFDTLKALREYALSRLDQDGELPDREARLSMGTASKVVQQLEDELLIRREERGLYVLNAERLMDGLKTNYRPPEGVRLTGKTSLSAKEVWQRLGALQTVAGTGLPWRYAATGLGSAVRYRVLSGPDRLSLYVTDLDRAANLIELSATRVFPNVELIEERDDAAYFDARRNGIEIWASPVQTWLELATAGPRERDAAQGLESALAQNRGEQIT